MKKIKNLISKSKQGILPVTIPPCLRGGPLRNITNKPPTPDHQSSNPVTSTNHSVSSTHFSSQSSPSVSSSTTDVSEAPAVKWVMVQSRFAWYEILLAMSFGVPIALFSVTYEYVGGQLVPVKLFESNPKLFDLFNMLDALAFTASVIGFVLHSVHERTSKYLALFAFACLTIAFYVFLWVLFPSYLKWVSFLLLSVVSLLVLYVHWVKGNNHSLAEYHVNLGGVSNGSVLHGSCISKKSV